MRILLFAAVLLLFVLSNAQAYTITTDEGLFRSLYQFPSEAIDFGITKEGVTPWELPSWEHTFEHLWYSTTRDGYNVYGVGGGAFSDKVTFSSGIIDSFGSYRVKGAVEWLVDLSNPNDRFIEPAFFGPYSGDYYDTLEIKINYFSPVAFYTDINRTNFIGLLPSYEDENIFKISNSIAPQIYYLETGFSEATPVPEPSTFLLMGAGLGGLTLFRRRAKK